jgi:hypothetical protein
MNGDYTNTYWNNKGRFQTEADIVIKLIPAMGAVPGGRGKNKCLERLRRAVNAYHDVYNNGGGNRNADIRYFLKVSIRDIRGCYMPQEAIDTMEEQMDKYIMEAYSEQTILGNINPVGQMEFAI